MLTIGYQPSFVRIYKKLYPEEQASIKEKIELLKDPHNHERLKVHKLTGRLSGFYSFSITHSMRIVFKYGSTKKEVILLEYGDHSIYH